MKCPNLGIVMVAANRAYRRSVALQGAGDNVMCFLAKTEAVAHLANESMPCIGGRPDAAQEPTPDARKDNMQRKRKRRVDEGNQGIEGNKDVKGHKMNGLVHINKENDDNKVIEGGLERTSRIMC